MVASHDTDVHLLSAIPGPWNDTPGAQTAPPVPVASAGLSQGSGGVQALLAELARPWSDVPACSQADPQLWDLHVEGELWASKASNARWEQAMAVCRDCPVLKECRQRALAGEVDGVWAGSLFAAGQQLDWMLKPVRQAEVTPKRAVA